MSALVKTSDQLTLRIVCFMLGTIMEKKDYRLAAIMYTDIVGFSRMMEQNEAATLELLHFHNRLITDICTRRHGNVIKTIGDAFLVDFRNTVEALQCAMEIQDAVYEHNRNQAGQILLLRIGVHLGDIYFFENDALGEGINIASRLQSFARPGTICFSQDVYNQVINKIEFRAEKLGKISLKNISKEIHAYEIASLNVEFDPEADKPRPGYSHTEKLEKLQAKPLPGGTSSPAERSYDPDSAKNIMDDIRKALLEDTRNLGRRLTVAEALERYGEYGVEAQEVIATMADKGILVKRKAPANPGSASTGNEGPSDLARDIGRAVEGIARAIEIKVGDWQQQSRQQEGRERGSFHRQDQDTKWQTRLDNKMDGLAARIERHAERAVDSIEHHVAGKSRFISEKHAIKEELRRHSAEVGTGKWDAELKGSDYFKPGSEEIETDFGVYKTKVEERSRKSATGFIGNFISFVGVNALLWYINLTFAPGFLWAAIVSLSWGTGIISNFFAMVRGKTKVAELERLPSLQAEALDTYKKLNRVKDSMAMHTASLLSVPPLLFTINLLTSPGFLWAAIPSGIMVLSFLGHLASFPVTKRGLEKKLFRLLGVDSWKELFRAGKGRNEAVRAAGPYASIYAEAAAARDELVKEIKKGKGSDDFGKDMIPTLDRYVEQVKLLTHSVNEIDGLVNSIPVADLHKDREDLRVKMESAGSTALKEEYRRSIAEIERQEKAYKDLEDQREILRLRLGSSVNSLKQLKIDLARMKAMPQAADDQAIQAIRQKAAEMTGYLDDLRTGYTEATRDPFEELERLAAEAEEQKKLPDGDT